MNKDFNLNVRTLIVSFVFALMILVPLRFVELGNQVEVPTVLGESTQVEVEALDCLDNEYVDKVVTYLTDSSDIENFESRRCQE